jgi:hypothetical protein
MSRQLYDRKKFVNLLGNFLLLMLQQIDVLVHLFVDTFAVVLYERKKSSR